MLVCCHKYWCSISCLHLIFISIAWQARMFYILEKQNAELVELKRMVSLLVKNSTATHDNDEPSLPEGIHFPLESEEALQALEGVTRQGYSKCW